MSLELTIRIPGAPFSQPRPRATVKRLKDGTQIATVYEPKEAKDWKGRAQVHMFEALKAAGLQPPAFAPEVPLEAFVLAVFACPTSDYRKRDPVGRRPYLGMKDWDNIGKAVCDAANGVLYVDDRYISRGTVECWVGAQEEAPYVEVTVRQWFPVLAMSDRLKTQELLQPPLFEGRC